MPEDEKPSKSAEIKVIKQTSEVRETTSAAVAASDNLAETKHVVTIAGHEVKYTALAGTMILREEAADREKGFEGEKARAQIFFVAYTKDDVHDKSSRPITFCFNGGPGSLRFGCIWAFSDLDGLCCSRMASYLRRHSGWRTTTTPCWLKAMALIDP